MHGISNKDAHEYLPIIMPKVLIKIISILFNKILHFKDKASWSVSVMNVNMFALLTFKIKDHCTCNLQNV